MSLTPDERRLLLNIIQRLEHLEQRMGFDPFAAEPAPPAPPAPPVATEPSYPQPQVQWVPPAPQEREESRSLEELVGGRLFAWLGGLLVLIAVASFCVLAIDRHWISQEVQMMLVGLFSAGLTGLGARMFAQGRGGNGSLAVMGSGLGGMYLTLFVSYTVYEVIGLSLSLAGVLVVSALGYALADTWKQQLPAWLAATGSIGACVLVGGSDPDTPHLIFLGCSLAATLFIALRREWWGLSWVCTAVTGLVLGAWSPQLTEPLLWGAWVAYWGVAQAMGLGMGAGEEENSDLLTLGAILSIGCTGLAMYALLSYGDSGPEAGWLILGFVVAHTLLTVCAWVLNILSMSMLQLRIGIILFDVALILLSDVEHLAGWALVPLALLIAFPLVNKKVAVQLLSPLLYGSQLAYAGACVAAGHVAILIHNVDSMQGVDAYLWELAPSSARVVLLFAIGHVALSFAIAEIGGRNTPLSIFTKIVAILCSAALAYLWFGPLGFVLFGLSSSLALGAAEDKLIENPVRVSCLYVIYPLLLLMLVPSNQLIAWDPFFNLALMAVSCLALAWIYDRVHRQENWIGYTLAGVSWIGLSSLWIGLHVDGQNGGLLLSAYWLLVGLGCLVVGLKDGQQGKPLRILGLGLMLLAAGKVIIYDLDQFDPVYRIISALLAGGLLISGAWLYAQREARDKQTRDRI